ncbi:hypothetical protein [Mycobacterium sp. 852002-30065_SCH5024008]|uniref:hypothetical protein n=1 Tax=Mycobacterium sp. 852002-30065_SCH5024008 TaxID=1834088 RepID=UPI000AFDAC11|nr:hypothetical protein [Mycobacterium sp. 852002-30065_SCH5024008]
MGYDDLDEFDDFDADEDIDSGGGDSDDDDGVAALQLIHDLAAQHDGVYCSQDNVP